MALLPTFQPLHDATRAVHGAAFYDPKKGIVLAREDVGRHNALDKLVGAMIRQGADRRRGAVLITSRVSIDMVQKVLRAGAPILIAVSAPTASALELAERKGLTVIALARGKRFEIFCHARARHPCRDRKGRTDPCSPISSSAWPTRSASSWRASRARSEALEGLAAHINDFWDPRMRRQFVAAMEADPDLPARELVRRPCLSSACRRTPTSQPTAPPSPVGSEPINPAHRG